MQTACGATSAEIKPASLMMWESYDYIKDKEEKDFFYNLLINEPNFNPEQLRILKIDDRIVATVLVAKRELFDGNQSLVLGGIGDVAVHPDFRGKGLSILILQDAVDYMIQQGFNVSTLYTGHQGLYEKVGYKRLSGRGYAAGRVPGEMSEILKTKDWRIAKDLFEKSISKLSGAMIRSEAYWNTYITGRWLRVADIVYSNDKSAYAMVKNGAEPGNLELLDAGYADSIEQLQDLLRNKFAGFQLGSPYVDLNNPLVLAIKSVTTDTVEESSFGMMARSLSGKTMPTSFFDMQIDRF